jgi:hypothetical protein
LSLSHVPKVLGAVPPKNYHQFRSNKSVGLISARAGSIFKKQTAAIGT